MNNREFERIIDEQFARCKDLLCTKQAEYTPDRDVFEVFNKASTLSGVGGRKSALFDFMLKHLVSISDMCHTEEYFTIERWNEKITDAMNYLLLLRAMVAEDEERTKGHPLPEPCRVREGECAYTQDCGDCFYHDCDGSREAFLDCGDNCSGCPHNICTNPSGPCRAEDSPSKPEEIARDDPRWVEKCGMKVPDKPSYASWDEMAKAVEKDCRTCDMAIWSLNADKSKDKPVCLKKAVGGCDGDARVPGGDIPSKPEEIARDDLFHPDMTCNGDCNNCRWGGCSLPENNDLGCPEDCITCSYCKCENPNFRKEETLTTTEGCGTCNYEEYGDISVNPKDCMEDCEDCEWFECTDKSDYLCAMSCSTCEYKVCHKHDEDGSNGGICDLDCNNCGDQCAVDEEQKRCQGECQSCPDDNCPVYWTYHSGVRGKDEASDKDKEEFWSSVSTEEPIPVSKGHTEPEGSEESLELFKAYVASLDEKSRKF